MENVLTKEDIRNQYQDCVVGYGHAIYLLMTLFGFTEYAADDFLFNY